MKKIFIFLFSVFLLSGCMSNKASDAVKSYLNQYQNLEDGVLDDLNELTEKEILTDNQKKSYIEVMKKQYQDLKYEIVSENYDGDSAVVAIKITVYDLYKAQEDSENYKNNNMKEFYDENNVYDNTTFLDYKINQMKLNNETVSYTLNFNVTKKDNKWVVEQPSQEDLEKIHGIYNYEE